MQLKEFLLTQFEREAQASRKAIERVPEGQNSWKPHPKSMEFGIWRRWWRRCRDGPRS